MKAIVADRGQVTIPKALRQRLGIRPKTVLDFQEVNGALVVRKIEKRDVVADVLGCLKLDRRTDDIIGDVRGTL